MAKAAGGVSGGKGGDAAAGMDKADLKRLLRLSREEPISAAFALGGDGKAVVVLDRRKPGRTLEKQLKDEAPDSKNHRWGTAAVDADDPKLVRFVVNKVSSGMGRKLVVALKGTGFSKVRVALEDGTEVEADEERDETEAAESGGSAAQDAAAGAAAAPQPGAAPAGGKPELGQQASDAKAGQPDAASLTLDLTELSKQIAEAIARDPGRKDTLVKLAAAAQASLKSGDLGQAAAGIESLRQALDMAKAGGGGSALASADARRPGNGQAQPGDAAPHPAAPRIAKARAAWAATRQRIDGEIAKLTKEFEAAFADHHAADELVASFKTRVDSVLHHLDDELFHKLDEVNKAADGAQRTRLVEDAHKLIDRYSQHIAGDETIRHLDENPLVPMQLGRMLTATLATLSKSIR